MVGVKRRSRVVLQVQWKSLTVAPKPICSAYKCRSHLGFSLVIAIYPFTQQSVRSWRIGSNAANTHVRPFAEPLLHTVRFDGSIVPGLATSWEISNDGRS